jgi:hypothetical protein
MNRTRKHVTRKHVTRKCKDPHYRKSYLKKYGSACFLDPIHLRYPICTQGKVDCKALSAARYYAMMLKDRKVLSKLRRTRRCVS